VIVSCPPDLFGWIAARSLGVDEVLRAAGSVRGLDLDKVNHLEPVRAQQPDPIPVARGGTRPQGAQREPDQRVSFLPMSREEHTLTPAWQRYTPNASAIDPL
jgi:hypothetical protein